MSPSSPHELFLNSTRSGPDPFPVHLFLHRLREISDSNIETNPYPRLFMVFLSHPLALKDLIPGEAANCSPVHSSLQISYEYSIIVRRPFPERVVHPFLTGNASAHRLADRFDRVVRSRPLRPGAWAATGHSVVEGPKCHHHHHHHFSSFFFS